MAWFLDIALGLLGAVLTYLAIDDLVRVGIAQAARDAGVDPSLVTPDLVEQARSQVAGVVTGFAVFTAVLLVALVFLVLAMRRGRNWARIVLAVLGVLAFGSALLGLGDVTLLADSGGLGQVIVLLTFAQLVAVVVATVLMFVRTGGYFRRG
ncbi:MAG: hypothetical protein ACT4RN_12020 [Pseudonocardia sp.]